MSSNLPPEEMTAQVRRQTPTERLHEVTMAYAQRPPSAPEQTLELERDRNGNILIRLAVRNHDISAVIERGVHEFDFLCGKYPRDNGGPE